MIGKINVPVTVHWEMFTYWLVETSMTLISRFYVLLYNSLRDFKKANWLHALEIHMTTMYAQMYRI